MEILKRLIPVLLFVILLLTACDKDNPVKPEDGFNLDTAHFRWEITPIPFDDFFLSGLWAADTNEVFAINLFYGAMLHIKGDVVETIYYTDSTRYNFIDGLSPTEGYMVCSEFSKGVWLPAIKRWNGNSFADIPMVSNYNKTFKPCSFLLKSSTEMWIGDNGLVHKFDGLNLTQQYFQDSEIVAVNLFFDQNNHLMAHGKKSSDSITYEYQLEYNGSEWIKSFEDSHLAWFKPYGVMNNFLYAYDYPNIYKVED
ncbi:MAG: hypothetical protein LWX07_06230, partial [Bacteroidetes bacterium]|nr:hypothetical protein [Bacteroidota bacterium]